MESRAPAVIHDDVEILKASLLLLRMFCLEDLIELRRHTKGIDAVLQKAIERRKEEAVKS